MKRFSDGARGARTGSQAQALVKKEPTLNKKENATITKKYLWQGMTQLLAVYDGSNNLKMRFIYADSRMPVAVVKSGTTYYLSYDQVGSLKMVSDTSGVVQKQVEYDTFGYVLSVSGNDPSFEIPFGFAGGLYDPDTELVRFGFRDYDPDLGRWTAKDPILFMGGDTDLYGYCVGDPLNFSDPEGLWTLQGGVSFTLGGITGSTKGGGIIIGRNPSTGDWQFGLYGVGGAGAFGGASASLMGDVTLSSNPCIEDVSGWATTAGGSLGTSILGFGGEMNTPLSGTAKRSYTGSLGFSTPGPEGHGFATYTYVKRLY